ncbi:MAG: dicarboxylate/amino acid:cation symporter [Eubacteriaceae bacterium]|nr:dicarboxylate/amino acid:cation symporter [Eubacteriaceae bacterium]
MQSKTIQITASPEHLAEAKTFIDTRLRRRHISEEIRSETLEVFEALFCHMLDQGYDPDTAITLKTRNKSGEVDVKFGFEGKPFVAIRDDGSTLTAEEQTLKKYEDLFDCSYRNGYNSIDIVVQRSFRHTLLLNLASVLVAILAFVVISAFFSPSDQAKLGENLALPLVKMFSNAMLMIGAPVTFFSLVHNFTDIYIISEKNSASRRMQVKTIITSVIAVILAIVAGIVITNILSSELPGLAGAAGSLETPTTKEVIESLVPSSIFVPFETLSPFPLIFLTLIVTYAFCNVGKYFDKMKTAVDVCFTLFSKMLHVVMSAFPFFCVMALLYPLLINGIGALWTILYIIALSAASLVLLVAFYLIRLVIGGVKLGPFFKHLPEFMIENFKIGSVIDAVPYTIRYCEKNYGMDRERITDKFSILAQINLDGNCYIIMLMGMFFIYMMVSQVSWYHVIVVGIIVLFLSLGAPNQPGSVLIGTLIIALFLKADVLIPTAVYLEVFFGAIQNIINVAGNIVTVAIDEKQVWSQPQTES